MSRKGAVRSPVNTDLRLCSLLTRQTSNIDIIKFVDIES